MKKCNDKNAWWWIPSLYYAEGIPYVVVMTASVIMYKNLGISNVDIALYTSWLYLPWVIKPFWSPIVDMFKTKRWWIIIMQLIIGGAMAGVAFTLPMSNFFQYTLAFFWVMAFSSATHDIAADGFYMLGLDDSEQAFFVGIRSTFYRLAMITGQGAIVVLVGYLNGVYENMKLAWTIALVVLSIMFILFSLFHWFVLPRPAQDKKAVIGEGQSIFSSFIHTFVLFFKKPKIGYILAFLLLYRLGEAQLVKMASPFLLDSRLEGGLGLSNTEVGLIYGTVGVIALTLGGILGGILASRRGLKYWLVYMIIAINLPNGVYAIMAWLQPESIYFVSAMVALEQFGYGFGFTAYMLYMIYISEGNHRTAHFAITTGIMALGMMLPGMVSGWLQEFLGYSNFFVWVLLCAIPILFVIPKLTIDSDFGKKHKKK